MRCLVRISEWLASTPVTPRTGHWLNGQVFATGRPIVVDDYWSWAGAEPSFSPDPVGPVASVPLVWKGQVLGVLEASGRQGSRPFSDAEVSAMSLLAAQA